MSKYRIGTLAILMILLISSQSQAAATTPHTAQATNPPASRMAVEAKLDARLKRELVANPARLEYLVVLTEQADTANDISPLRWAEKGWFVYNRLRETAERSQAPLRQAVAGFGTEQAHIVRSFYIMNALLVEGTPASLYELAARSDVKRVYSNARRQVAQPDTSDSQPSAPSDQPQAELPNMLMIRAPEVWATGNTGQGVTIGSNDRGVNYTHPALNPKWRGTATLPGPDYNWYDAVNSQNTEPYEEVDSSIGTGSVSILTGEEPGVQRIGVAPGANWIACKMIDQGFSSTPAIALTCLQWMLAPTDRQGQNPRPDLRPQVVSNGWAWEMSPPITCDYVLRPALQAWVNAGIYPVFNSGDRFGSGTPSVNYSPNNYLEARSTGALRQDGTLLTSFNGTGPSACAERNPVPLLMAPGDRVRTARSDTLNYATYSGTKPAAAHQAGAVALLLRHNMGLTVSETTYYLTSTAHFTPSWGSGEPPLGGPAPNGTYGWGMIDVAAAIAAAPPLTLTVTPTAQPTTSGTATPTHTPSAAATPPSTTTILPTAASATTTVSSTSTPPPSATSTSAPPTPLLTSTSTPPPTASITPQPSPTPIATSTNTSTSTSTSTPQPSPSPTATVCNLSFTDVPLGYVFRQDILYLACRGIVAGYAGGNFRPESNTTRGEFSKIATLAFGVATYTPTNGQTFSDVPRTHPFFSYVEAAARSGVIQGLGDGSFGIDRSITRADTSLIVVRARGFALLNPTAPTFLDVPADFYAYRAIETLYARGIISGGPRGGGLIFRPTDFITRGELSKVTRRSINQP